MSSPRELEQRAAARLGKVLQARYRLDAVLGAGGTAAVYAATRDDGRAVAVKVLHDDLAGIEAIRARFLREAYAANRVAHPAVVRILESDVDTATGAVFLVMERIDGETLAAEAARAGGVLPIDRVLAIAHRLLDVLAVAHAAGVIHRDIKPANVMLTPAGAIHVMDFGIARLADLTLTRTGDLLGTPAYMAPEQAGGRTSDIDARTDVWSVGALIFALTSGRPVHEGTRGAAQMIYAATTPARSLAAAAPGAPHPVVALVDRALAFDRDARWPSAAAMRDAIRVLLGV
jgi:serine/threonine-protein kinase